MRHLATLATALALTGVAACGSPKPAPHSVAELADDPVLLQGIAVRCAADKHAAASDADCVNARLAVERLAAAEEAKHVGERGAEFERQREQRRVAEDQKRRATEGAQPGFDPYSSPITSEKPLDPAKP